MPGSGMPPGSNAVCPYKVYDHSGKADRWVPDNVGRPLVAAAADRIRQQRLAAAIYRADRSTWPVGWALQSEPPATCASPTSWSRTARGCLRLPRMEPSVGEC
jgi:hypothetical protein